MLVSAVITPGFVRSLATPKSATLTTCPEKKRIFTEELKAQRSSLSSPDKHGLQTVIRFILPLAEPQLTLIVWTAFQGKKKALAFTLMAFDSQVEDKDASFILPHGSSWLTPLQAAVGVVQQTPRELLHLGATEPRQQDEDVNLKSLSKQKVDTNIANLSMREDIPLPKGYQSPRDSPQG
ncbi:hypothetical protein Vadar_024077 [Vaccinium darrowii]|uniref:Uncharacterized protein n=1 Tax=Vaccinium darrowii TaxID=229202 RepID=A0ACB7Y9T3_9ERIC|nr:hypothetical protein Vadar_024077 [Vaccinium darrowii]